MERGFLGWADVEMRYGFTESAAEGWFIYALVDPRDETVRYVGQTKSSPDARLGRHRSRPVNSAMARWFAELAPGLPRMRVLQVTSEPEWEVHEMEWIAWFRHFGKLLNVDPGGEYRGRRGKVEKPKRRLAARITGDLREGMGLPRSTAPRQPKGPWAWARGQESERLAQIAKRQRAAGR